MKRIVTLVQFCADCDFLGCVYSGSEFNEDTGEILAPESYFCDLELNGIDDPFGPFPEWCPLEDKPE